MRACIQRGRSFTFLVIFVRIRSIDSSAFCRERRIGLGTIRFRKSYHLHRKTFSVRNSSFAG